MYIYIFFFTVVQGDNHMNDFNAVLAFSNGSICASVFNGRAIWINENHEVYCNLALNMKPGIAGRSQSRGRIGLVAGRYMMGLVELNSWVGMFEQQTIKEWCVCVCIQGHFMQI